MTPDLRALRPGPNDSLDLEWSTGTHSYLPYRALRLECPCASCVDEMTGKRVLRPESIPENIRIQGIELVGRYAVRIQWSDSHSSGIYALDRLYQLGKTQNP